jgi:hypothetical protein
VSFILRWLGLGAAQPGVGLHPRRDVALALPYDAAFDGVLDAIDRVLGANVAACDRKAGTIEAAFGLVNSERVRCSVQRADAGRTAVRIEAYFPAGAEVPARSRAVDALAESLERLSG